MSSDPICNCGSVCNCGKGCRGHPQYPGKPRPTNIETVVLDVAPVMMHYEVPEMGFGAEGGCKCGPNCKCNPCDC